MRTGCQASPSKAGRKRISLVSWRGGTNRQSIILSPKVNDTIGAGDTFTDAFAVALVKGKSRKECFQIAGINTLSGTSPYLYFLFYLFLLSNSSKLWYSYLLWFCSCSSFSLCSCEGGHPQLAWNRRSWGASWITLSGRYHADIWFMERN